MVKTYTGLPDAAWASAQPGRSAPTGAGTRRHRGAASRSPGGACGRSGACVHHVRTGEGCQLVEDKVYAGAGARAEHADGAGRGCRRRPRRHSPMRQRDAQVQSSPHTTLPLLPGRLCRSSTHVAPERHGEFLDGPGPGRLEGALPKRPSAQVAMHSRRRCGRAAAYDPAARSRRTATRRQPESAGSRSARARRRSGRVVSPPRRWQGDRPARDARWRPHPPPPPIVRPARRQGRSG